MSSSEAPTPELSAEQRRVLRLVEAGRNVFFTGSAGTGKSFLLERVVAMLRAKHGSDRVAVAAPSGVAAANIGGQTLCSALGIGAPQLHRQFDRMLEAKNAARVRRWHTLVVDEVSMMSAEFVEALDERLRALRRSDLPAGGLQVNFSLSEGASGFRPRCGLLSRAPSESKSLIKTGALPLDPVPASCA